MAAQGFRYVGFWLRVVAALIDMLVIGFVLSPVLAVLGISGDMARTMPELALTGLKDQQIMPLVVANVLSLVLTVWVIRQWAATPGKMAFGARIVDANNGQPLGMSRIILRQVCYFISAFALGLGFLWIAIDRRKQAWHDKIAGSVVVRPGGDVTFDRDAESAR